MHIFNRRRRAMTRLLVLLVAGLLLIGCGQETESTYYKANKTTVQEKKQDKAKEKTENKKEEKKEDEEKDPYDSVTMVAVDSSAISELGYSKKANTLYIRFKESGVLYEYYDVPESEYKNLKNADSIGKYFNSDIKGTYDYSRRDD